MKVKVITPRETTYLVQFENSMLEHIILYTAKIRNELVMRGVDLVIELEWSNWLTHEWSKKRISFQNGYRCYINCYIQKDGKCVGICSNDGEADYYLLLSSTNISHITRKFFKFEIGINSDMDEIIHGIEDLQSKLDNEDVIRLVDINIKQ